MPDLGAGSDVAAEDTPPTVWDIQNDSFTFNSTSFGVDNDTGTYNDCGTAFVAPTTGRVLILYEARLGNDTTGQGTLCTPVVREGGTVGSGTTVLAASDNDAIQLTTASTANVISASRFRFLDGLTPGDTYNVRLEHRVGGGIGTLSRRAVGVVPCT